MKDIKSLYMATKFSGKANDLSAYTEAVYDLLDVNPKDYILNLEYIIVSSDGLDTWNQFIERYGLPLACYDNVIELFESCCKKCKAKGVSSDKYEEELNKLKDFKENNQTLFDMYEYYAPEDVSDYIESYYSFSEKGFQNRKLIGGMVKQFGEAALPDALITAAGIGENAVKQWFEFVNKNYADDDILNEWITEATKTEEEEAIVNKISSFCKDLKKLLKKDLKSDIKESNHESRAQNRLHFIKHVYIYLQDEEGRFRRNGGSGKDSKHKIYKFINSARKDYEDGKKFTENAKIEVRYQFAYGLYAAQINSHRQQQLLTFTKRSLENSLAPYIEQDILKYKLDENTMIKGKVDLSEYEEIDDYTEAYDTTQCITFSISYFVYLNTKYIFENMKLNESSSVTLNSDSLKGLQDSIDSCSNTISLADFDKFAKEKKKKMTLKDTVNVIKNKKNDAIKESYLLGTDPVYELTESEIKSVEDLITLREYQMTCTDDEDLSHEIYEEVLSLYDLLEEKTETEDSSEDSSTEIVQFRSRTAPREAAILAKKNIKVESLNVPKEVVVIFGDNSHTVNLSFFTKVSNVFDEKGTEIKDASFTEVPLACFYFNKLFKNNKICGVKDIKLSRYLDKYIKEKAKETGRENEITKDFIQNLKVFGIKAKAMTFKPDGCIGFTFDTNLDPEHGIGLNVRFNKINSSTGGKSKKGITYGDDKVALESYNLDEDCVDILAFLPSANTKISEDTWYKNTLDKKNSHLPGYLKKNYDMATWGEDDNGSEDGEEGDEFKRPSASSSSSDDDIEYNDDSSSGSYSSSDAETRQAMTNNYYYYTYNNSLNRNQGSFNKHISNDSSTKDNHSYHDDHSTNKRYRSDDNINQKESTEITEKSDYSDQRPESDHPIRNALQDAERKGGKVVQGAKKTIGDVQNVGRMIKKPYDKTKGWVLNTISNWTDKDENRIKEKMTDPHARKGLLSALGVAIKGGALLKAGLLLNPIFIFLAATRKVSEHNNSYRIRNELIADLQNEMKIIDEKIKQAEDEHKYGDKYKLLRFKNELQKKLLRVAGSNTRSWKRSL